MFLIMPSTKIAQTVQLGWTKWPPELKIEISWNDISLVTGQNIISSGELSSALGPFCFLIWAQGTQGELLNNQMSILGPDCCWFLIYF